MKKVTAIIERTENIDSDTDLDTLVQNLMDMGCNALAIGEILNGEKTSFHDNDGNVVTVHIQNN